MKKGMQLYSSSKEVETAADSGNNWPEVRHKKNGANGGVVSKSNAGDTPTPADDVQHIADEFNPVVSSSENPVNKVLMQCNTEDEKVEASDEDRVAMELAKKLEEDFARLQKARENMERAHQAYKTFKSNNLTSSGGIFFSEQIQCAT